MLHAHGVCALGALVLLNIYLVGQLTLFHVCGEDHTMVNWHMIFTIKCHKSLLCRVSFYVVYPLGSMCTFKNTKAGSSWDTTKE